MKKPDFCARCGVFHVEPCPRMLSRRRFLFLGAAAGITLAAAPLDVTWFRQSRPADLQLITGILKDVYEPAIAEVINTPTLFASVTLTGAEIRDSVHYPGRFMQAMIADLKKAARDAERVELVNLGRGRLALTDQAS